MLAYVTPPMQAIDVSDMRQRQGELDQQISIVERRLARYETAGADRRGHRGPSSMTRGSSCEGLRRPSRRARQDRAASPKRWSRRLPA